MTEEGLKRTLIEASIRERNILSVLLRAQQEADQVVA